MKKINRIIIFLCVQHFSVAAVEWWTIGICIVQPLLSVFVQRLFAKDQKTERDRVNESLAVQLAVLNSLSVSPELKKQALQAILRQEEKVRCLDIKEYLESVHRQKEDQDLAAWADKEVKESSKKILQMMQNSV